MLSRGHKCGDRPAEARATVPNSDPAQQPFTLYFEEPDPAQANVIRVLAAANVRTVEDLETRFCYVAKPFIAGRCH